MFNERCGIYYRFKDISELDIIINFLQQEGLIIKDFETQKVFSIDCEGEKYETDLIQIKHNILNNKVENIFIFLEENFVSDSIWSIKITNNCWIQEFSFSYLENDKIDELSKIVFSLSRKEIFSKNSFLGMYIDRFGRTYEYDFDPFFVKDEGTIDCFTDLICVPEEKLSRVKIDSTSDTVRWLENGFVCASNNSSFLEYLLN